MLTWVYFLWFRAVGFLAFQLSCSTFRCLYITIVIAQFRKRDADLFGSQELPIPPSCLIITVWGKITDNTEELMSYSVSLNEVDSDSEEICINRFLETSSATEV